MRREAIPNLKEVTSRLRTEITESSKSRRAAFEEDLIDEEVEKNNTRQIADDSAKISRRANIRVEFPPLPAYEEIERLNKHFYGMMDLESVIVIAGFSELGPYGNSRTRWEMEAFGKLSLEECMQMAWMMGLIKSRKKYNEWSKRPRLVDGSSITDLEIKKKYEPYILAHSGIPTIEPRPLDGLDPTNNEFLNEVVIQHDLEPFEASQESALDFQRERGDKVTIAKIKYSDEYSVQLKRGATTMTRRGFVESEGCGIQLVTIAKLGLDIGLRIYEPLGASTRQRDSEHYSGDAQRLSITNARHQLSEKTYRLAVSPD